MIASQARVALADDVAHALKAKLVITLIGERPGLSSPDSLGIYMTHGPFPAVTMPSATAFPTSAPKG